MQRSSPLYVLSNCGGPSVTAPPLLAPLSSGEQQQQQQQQLYSMLPIDPLSGHPQQQQQQEQHQEQVAEATPLGGRCALKRKLSVSSSETNPDRGYPVAYSSVTVPDSGAKVCKDTVPGLSGVEVHEFPAFGQAFGVSGIGQFYVLGTNDSNNNNNNNNSSSNSNSTNSSNSNSGTDAQHQHHQHHNHQHQHHHQQQQQQQDQQEQQDHHMAATYIYDVTEAPGGASGGGSPEGVVETVVPISEHYLLTSSDAVHQASNGVVLTDISSSTWTSTAELLDLDRKSSGNGAPSAPTTVPTDVHQHRYPILSADHQHTQHHHQQQQQQQQHAPSHHLLQQQQQQHHHHHHHHHHPHQQQQQQQQQHLHNNQQANQPQPYEGAVGQQQQQQYGVNNQSSTGRLSFSFAQPFIPFNPTCVCVCFATLLAAQTPEAPEDCKNLSWLLNFKLDDLPNLSPRSNRKQKAKLSASGATGPGDGANVAGTTVATGTTAGGVHVGTGGGGADQQHHVAVAIEEGDLNVGENVTIESSGGKYPKKPPFTYTELIEYALVVHGDLTVAAIYQWISEHFPYYKSHDDRWKNSVRHNLSINPHFRKGRKSSHGSGHLWTISSRNSEENSLAWEHKKQRFQWYFQMEADARVRKSGTGPETMVDDEVAAATASLAQYAQKSPNTQSPVTQTIEIVNPPTSEQNPQQQQQHRLQAHALQQNQAQQQQQHQPHQLTYHPTQTLYADIISNAQFEITATAEEIKHLDEETLNGMGRGTEIQIVRPIQTIQTYEMLDSEYNIADYLNPVPKEEIVQECGLRSVALDPAELGINIPSTNDQDNDMLFDDFSLNYFGSNIMT
ncbi:uncharacterized protein LOC118467267 [Anopheles albimanus]|uniref:uncharacterized protein LOC118467267 n=1 Tax=Anopheles albimanus TaxID=7167 RepID=UPI00163E0B30|nr:uncharacterized protein LOC118467267 [Anopheles albimanus]